MLLNVLHDNIKEVTRQLGALILSYSGCVIEQMYFYIVLTLLKTTP